MANIVQRNFQKSIAATIIHIEKELGIQLDTEDALTFLNEKYGYVKEDDQKSFQTLNKQIELDVAAEKHAQNNPVKVSKFAVVSTMLDRESGTLTSCSEDGKPKGA